MRYSPPVAPDAFPRRFPSTRYSVVARLASGEKETRRAALEDVVAAYWRPVYSYLRLRWRLSPLDAEDLTQSFFLRALEKEDLGRYDPARARFRTFLRACLDAFAANAHRDAARMKRGGGTTVVTLDFDSAEGELAGRPPVAEMDEDAFFRAEVARAVFARAVEALREECGAAGKGEAFEVFRAYDVEGADTPVTYDDVARRMGIPVTQVTNRLFAMRRRFRAHVLEALRALTASEEEFRAEARELLGGEPWKG